MKITVPIFVQEAAPAIALMRQAAEAGADLVELRCDQASLETIEEVVRAKTPLRGPSGPLEVIVTIRPTWEGGLYDGEEQQRISLFEHAGLAGADYLDLEWVAWQRSANLRQKIMLVCRHPEGRDDGPRLRGAKLILSHHDFSGRPADLQQRLAGLCSVAEASMFKLVWKAQGFTCGVDALRMMHEHRDARPLPRPLQVLAMGEMGQISRLLGAKFGAPWTFATIPGGPPSAPGQPSLQELREVYRYSEQRPEDPVFGIIGWPASHSMSPAIHNAGFARVGFRGIYLPLAIPETYDDFAAALDALRQCPSMNFRGASVTLPHKENALRYLQKSGGQVEALSARIGAINSLVVEPDGPMRGFNSDYHGALEALASALGVSLPQLSGYRVAVLGAGGAARAIVAGLAHCGATVMIYNRNAQRAALLAEEFNGQSGQVVAAPLEALRGCEIFINCTPQGMRPNIDQTPLAETAFLDASRLVFDTIYNPLETRLLREARQAGAKTLSGLEMFVRQAVAQFEAFCHQPAPVELFRQVALKRLGGS